MPKQARPSTTGVELAELRVLDGPNRFFSRPAVKLELVAPEPKAVARAAQRVAAAVTALHEALELRVPRTVSRSSADGCRVAVAFPWRRRTISQAIGAAAVRVALGRSTRRRELSGLRAVAHGPLPALPRPSVPIVAITGTNGKSTTTRLVAHIATVAGRVVGMTNSDGIYVRGELVEAGDWTGFGGAGRVLAEPGLDLAVLETARGGILLRGIGYLANDVSVVTNVSADHLGLQGIDTLDELAEVKGVVAAITRRDGWAVLNAEDPRAWAMRRRTRAGWYAFAADRTAAGVAEALERGGRAAVVEDGWIVLRRAGRRRLRLAPAAELPITVGGLARHNVANALAAAAACDAVGIAARHIRAGLRSFGSDGAANPGRLNLFERRGIVVVVDYAHNEAGLAGLLAVCRALAGRHRVHLAYGTAGDRTDEILHALGRLAGEGAEVLAIAEKRHYLRGRDLGEMNALLRRGAAAAGHAGEIPALAGELAALQHLLAGARRGDVVAVMSHVERREIVDWLTGKGFVPPTGEQIARRIGS